MVHERAHRPITPFQMALLACAVVSSTAIRPCGPDDDEADAVSCDPDEAEFDGDEVFGQAGVEIDAANEDCSTVSGAPITDVLVVDKVDGAFSASGSGYEALVISDGTIDNQPGFYVLDDLPTDTLIELELQGQPFLQLEFLIQTGDGPPALRQTSVVFGEP